MSFCLDVSSPVVRSEPCVLRAIDRLFPCWTRTCVSLWATTQVHAHAHTGLRADYTRRIDLAFSHKLIGPPCIMLSDHYYLYDHKYSLAVGVRLTFYRFCCFLHHLTLHFPHMLSSDRLTHSRKNPPAPSSALIQWIQQQMVQ